MSRFVSDEPVPVALGACRCPGTPHDGQDGRDDGDIVYLRPALTLEGGLAIIRALRKTEDGEDLPSFATRMIPPYLKHGLAGWNFVDESGLPVPLTQERISHLDWDTAYAIGDKCDDLYGKEALAPLLARMPQPLRPGPMVVSISPNLPSRRTRRPRSGRSSPGTLAATGPSAT